MKLIEIKLAQSTPKVSATRIVGFSHRLSVLKFKTVTIICENEDEFVW